MEQSLMRARLWVVKAVVPRHAVISSLQTMTVCQACD